MEKELKKLIWMKNEFIKEIERMIDVMKKQELKLIEKQEIKNK